MSSVFRRLLPLFIEPIPEPDAEAVPKQRLTRFGQAMLACAIGALGVTAYLTSWHIGDVTAAKLQFCPVLGQDREPSTTLDSLSLTSSGDAANLLRWNYRLVQELVKDLKPATRPQRLLLNQQIASLTLRMSRQCSLVRYYRIQAGALATVSTGAAVLLVVTGLVRVPRGVASITRCEQAILTFSLSLLVLSIGYLTLGGQQAQARLNWAYHKKGLELSSLIRSSLATNQLLVPPIPGSNAAPEKPIPLDNAQAVSELVTRIDRWLLAVDQGSVTINNSFARQTFDNLFQNQPAGQAPSQPVNPLLSPP